MIQAKYLKEKYMMCKSTINNNPYNEKSIANFNKIISLAFIKNKMNFRAYKNK